jgi:hypothetical protein
VGEYATFLPVPRATAHLELLIDVDSDPISGSISNGANRARPFSGWIELVATIEAARSPLACDAGSGQGGWAGSKTLGPVPGAKGPGL